MVKELLNYIPKNEYEQQDKTYMLELYDIFKDKLFTRFKFFHFTASAVVFNKAKTKVLFIYHNIYNSWSWMGGHMDGEVDFYKVAVKEVLEESGIKDLKPVFSQPVSIEVLPVWQHLKDGKFISTHHHLNLTYAFFADEKEELVLNDSETSGVRWILIDELKDYVTENQMLPIYERIIKRVRK